MTFASLLLALVTATSVPAKSASSEPVLLDFHSQSCGPCQKMRKAIELLVEKGYPIKSVDIEREPELAARYRVHEVPTFVVIDSSGRVLDRTKGLQPAAELARFYRAAVARAEPPSNSNAHTGSPKSSRQKDPVDGEDDDLKERGDDRGDHAARPVEEGEERGEPVFSNPKPWKTVVRIRVLGARSIGFGSGTIVHSTPEESLVLTCAHIFKLEGRRPTPPAQFPRQIMVDLFDGNLQGTKPAQVHKIGSVEGQAVDYDFKRDVGLIRIKPGRRLPAARVVPAHWEPKARMYMLTVGCSEGHDATAWHTVIVRPKMKGLAGNAYYEAIECLVAPRQGRSGGGLFTTDGYLAGVCNFAEPQGDHGLYATPRSIYSLLDRNNLMALYAPVGRGSENLLADRRPESPGPRSGGVSVARSQSPDQDPPARSRRRDRTENDDVLIPPPNLLGIADPVSPGSAGLPKAAAAITHRTAWQPARDSSFPAASHRAGSPEQTDLNLDPAADGDRFGPPPSRPDPQEPGSARVALKSASSSASPSSPAKPHWRLVKVSDNFNKE